MNVNSSFQEKSNAPEEEEEETRINNDDDEEEEEERAKELQRAVRELLAKLLGQPGYDFTTMKRLHKKWKPIRAILGKECKRRRQERQLLLLLGNNVRRQQLVFCASIASDKQT